MGPTEINGLPAHALLVHLVVVLVPLAALVFLERPATTPLAQIPVQVKEGSVLRA